MHMDVMKRYHRHNSQLAILYLNSPLAWNMNRASTALSFNCISKKSYLLCIFCFFACLHINVDGIDPGYTEVNSD